MLNCRPKGYIDCSKCRSLLPECPGKNLLFLVEDPELDLVIEDDDDDDDYDYDLGMPLEPPKPHHFPHGPPHSPPHRAPHGSLRGPPLQLAQLAEGDSKYYVACFNFPSWYYQYCIDRTRF